MFGLFDSNGFGHLSSNDFDELRKAVSTGYDIGGTSQTGGGAMRIESLDSTLSVLTERERQIVFLKRCPRAPATSTALEYAQRTALATEHGGWYAEGELPDERDDSYARKAAFIKYAGTVKNVTLPAQLTQHVVDQVQEATEAGTMWVSRLLERFMFKGDSKLGLSSTEGYEIDGIERYIERDAHATTGKHVVNLWGRALEEADLQDAGQTIIDYHGIATDIFLPTQVLQDYALSYLPAFQHRPSDQQAGKLSVGYALKTLNSVVAEYSFNPLFLYRGLTLEQPPAASSSRAPGPAPTVTAAVQATATGEWANCLGVDDAAKSGSVEYKVCVANRFGESTAVDPTGGSVAISYANRVNSVRVTITNPAGGYTNAPSFATVYRRDTNYAGTVSDWGCVKRIPLTSVAGSGTLVWDDDGNDMAGTYRGWMLQMDKSIIAIRELLPFTRIPLPQIALSTRFALVAFLTLVVRDPFKLVN